METQSEDCLQRKVFKIAQFNQFSASLQVDLHVSGSSMALKDCCAVVSVVCSHESNDEKANDDIHSAWD